MLRGNSKNESYLRVMVANVPVGKLVVGLITVGSGHAEDGKGDIQRAGSCWGKVEGGD